MKEIKPKFHIFGHIHGSYGVHTEDNTTFVNVSVMDENYDVINKPTIINM